MSENRFFDWNYIHVDDGVVNISDRKLLPFEVVFRFFKEVDPKMKENARIWGIVTNNLDTPEIPQGETYLILHVIPRTSSEEIEAYIQNGGMEEVKPLSEWFKTAEVAARVARKGTVTHILWQEYLSDQSPYLIKTALMLKMLCPSLFNGKSNEYTDTVKNILTVAYNDTGEKTWAAIEPFYINVKKQQWLYNLKKMFIDTYGKQISAEEKARDREYETIEEYTQKIAACYRSIKDREIRIRGLKACNNTEQQYDDFIRYMDDIGGEIVNFTNDMSELVLRFKGYADNYDYEAACDLIGNTQSYLYKYLDEGDSSIIKTVYDAVFVKRKYKLRMMSDIKVRPSNYDYRQFTSPCSGVTVELDGKCYMMNPHLKHHNCYGDNAADIVKALAAYDYNTLAICLNSTNSNISFTDGTVMENMRNDILNNREKQMFEGKDGQSYSFDDILRKESESDAGEH